MGFCQAVSDYDRYAFRDQNYPFGPELLGSFFWNEVLNWPKGLFWIGKEEWIPVYSAFGGLGIYKRESFLKSSYSGVMTLDLEKYYRKIMDSLPKENHH